MKIFFAVVALLVCATLQAQTPYTLNLADGTTTVASPHRAGINLASVNYYDNGQIYKNLIGESNIGFENTLAQQIWALTSSGTTTTFCNTNPYAVYPVNFWKGATVTVVESTGAEAGYKGTVASSTAGTGSSAACYTVSTAAKAAFAAGDEIVVALNEFPTPEACWETSTNCSVWTNIANGGKLLTDSTTPHDGKQSLILDVTGAASAAAGAAFYFDSYNLNHFVVMNGTYEMKGWMKTGASAVNHVLTVCAGRVGSLQCKNLTPTSAWTQFVFDITLSETNTSANAGEVSAQISGTNGRGQVEIDDLSFAKISGQDSTNTSAFRDEFVDALREYCATDVEGPSCPIRNWTNQNGETMANWTASAAAALQTTAGAGAPTHGEITPRLFDYLNLVKVVGGTPYLVEPVTFQGTDPAALVEYLSSTNTGSGYGKIRADQGQVAPWVGPSGVFTDAYISFCNECWNGSNFSGQALPWRSAQSADYYHDYWNRAKDVFAEMRADPAFNTGIHLGFNLQLGVNYAPGGLDKALAGMAAVDGAADYVEQAPYEQSTLSSWQTDATLWGSAMEQPWEDAANPADKSGYYEAVKAIESYKYCGETGKLACVATNYEQANNTLTSCGVAGWPACTGGANQAIDQTHEDRINAGAGEGVIAPLQMALNQQQLGVTQQNYFGATEFSNGTLYGMVAKTSKLWGICIDYGGATSYLNDASYSCRPQFYGISILNQAIIGPEYSCALASGPTYSWPGSTVNGPTVAMAGVPYVYPFCYKGSGSNSGKRSIVLINTNLTTSYAIKFAGTNLPTGSCEQQQFAPSSPDLLNEAASGLATNTIATKAKSVSSSVACGSTMTLPPDSETAITYTVSSTPTVATPTFSVAQGTYPAAQTVTIADSTAGAKIYYTVNGTTPTTSSTLYSAAIKVSATETLHALAVVSGYTNSAVATATYTITATTAATPGFSVAAGSYTTAQSVTISDATAGAKIYYTVNGAAPTTSSTLYSAAIKVSATETLRAIAIVSGYTNSLIATATYTITGATAATPKFSVATGTYTTAQSVTISDTTAGAKLYYTVNGTAPTTSSSLYSAAIKVSATETLRAIAIVSGYTNSLIATATYTITSNVAATPVMVQTPGIYTQAVNVQIGDATSGAVLHYTLDGSTPTASSSTYSGYVAITKTATLKVIAVKAGLANSAVASGTYTIETHAATPKLSLVSGTYKGSQTETITDATAGAVIYYTTNQSTPTASSTRYTGPITVSGSEYVQAIAVAPGYTNSFVASANVAITK